MNKIHILLRKKESSTPKGYKDHLQSVLRIVRGDSHKMLTIFAQKRYRAVQGNNDTLRSTCA